MTTASPNKYQYNGKEWNADFGLEWNDYGARFYDPWVGRWWGVDAMAEKYSSFSVYNYTLNNPLSFIDPDGMMNISADLYNLNGTHIGNDGKNDGLVYLLPTTSDTQLTQEQTEFLISTEVRGKPVFVQNLNVTHSTFVEMAAWSYNENLTDEDAQKASLGMLMNWTTAKNVYYGFDNINTPQDALNLIYRQTGGTKSKYLKYRNKYMESNSNKRNGDKGMRSATAAAIHVLTGGKDFSNGAVQEHGKDFFREGWKMYKDQQKNGYTWVVGGAFYGKYTPTSNPEHKGADGGYKFHITASYGSNIYTTFSSEYKKK